MAKFVLHLLKESLFTLSMDWNERQQGCPGRRTEASKIFASGDEKPRGVRAESVNKHNQSGESGSREHLRGKYHCTVDLVFDRFRNVCLCKNQFMQHRGTFLNWSNRRSTAQ